MKKIIAVLSLILIQPFFVQAETTFQGQPTQPVSASSLPLPSGASTAAKQPALGTAGSASADVLSVQGVASMTALKVDGSAVTQPISAGSLPLPSGAATAAKQPALGTAGTPSSDVITVQGSASGTAIPVTMSQAVSVPAITKVGATTTSAQLIAANATRKSIEIDTDCANTDSVAINFGASAAVYASHKILPPCANWQAPPGVSVQTAVQVISNTGTQQVRVIEYP